MSIPNWLDRSLYPFCSHYFQTAKGNIHYIDEGEGPVLLFVHGNPTWSFTWRNLISEFSKTHRCIAPDLLGFGLSDNPKEIIRPADHSDCLESLMKFLQLKDVTVVVEDWGGPIALSWAVENSHAVKGVVVFNSWCWSVRGDPHFEKFSRFMGGAFGRFLIRRFNAFVRFVLPKAIGHRLPRSVRRHYLGPFKRSADRNISALLPKQIISESPWLNDVWEKCDVLNKKPMLILWGLQDIAFRAIELEKWKNKFQDAKCYTFENAGHCPHETNAKDVIAAMRKSILSSM